MIFCKKCGKEVDSIYTYCPHCGEYCGPPLSPYKTDYVSSATTSCSGTSFPVSSATAVTSSFSKIVDSFGDDPYVKISGDVFLVDTDTLEYYLGLGYLKKLTDGRFELTDLGRDAYRQNKIFRKKVDENLKNIKI